MSEGVELSGLTGETITRHPGSINGESVTLRDLTGCSVYILDHSSEVEATNCRDCQVFVGPVDGAAIFDDCSGCTVAVASQQFQARKCDDVDFGLFVATAPTVRSCKKVRVGCWVGAYPGLTRHFAAANLDPNSNKWKEIHDATPAEEREGDGERAPSFELVETSRSWWEVPIEGGEAGGNAPPDNPVPAADGALYSPPAAGNNATAADATPSSAAAAPAPFGSGLTPAPSGEQDPLEPASENGGSSATDPAPLENGGAPRSTTASAASETAAATAARERLARQEEAERAARADAQARAAAFLRDFHAKREAAAASRPKMATEAAPEGGGPRGATPWERVLSLLDLEGGGGGSARSSGAGGTVATAAAAAGGGADLSRFKAAMFTAKAKGLGL